MEVGRESFMIWGKFLPCKLWEAENSQEHWQVLCENSPASLLLVPSKFFQILWQSSKIIMGGKFEKGKFLPLLSWISTPLVILLPWQGNCLQFYILYFHWYQLQDLFPSISSFIQEKCSHVRYLPIIIFRFSSFSYSPEWFITVISTVPTLWLSNYSLYCLLLLFVLL